MNLHEYQSKKLLKSYQIDIPNGQIISSQIPDSIKLHLKKNTAFVFKSQIHALLFLNLKFMLEVEANQEE